MDGRARATSALSATETSLARLGRSIYVSLCLVAGFWFIVVSPTGGSWPGCWAGAACLVAGAAVWMAGERLQERSQAMAAAIPPVAMVAVAVIHVRSGQSAWWPAADVAAVGALIFAATAERLVRSMVSAGVVLAAAIAPELLMPEALSSSAGVTHTRSVQLVIVYVVPLVGVLVMRRMARRADDVGPESQVVLRAQMDAAAAADAQTAVQRVLHDTVLNTLETVANGVDAQRWPQLRQRCEHDLEVVGSIGHAAPSREITEFVDGLLGFGISLYTDVQWLADPPPFVREAVYAATSEAVRNAARHAGVDHVALRARVSADAVLVEVIDTGVGLSSTGPDRLGVRTSIVATMEAVGGFAAVDSAPGEGTRVTISWDSARARVSDVLSDMRRGLILLLTGVVAASLLIFGLFTVTDPGMAAPGTKLLTIAVSGAVAALLISAALRDAMGWPEFIIVLGGIGLVTMLLPLSDPYCTSLQSTTPFDLRALLMMAVALAVVTVRALVIAIVVLIVASAAANLLWIQLGASCGWNYLMTAGVAASIAVGNFWMVRTLSEQRRGLAEEAIAAEHGLYAEAQRTARMRESAAWNGREVTSAVRFLQEIAAGEPDSPMLRRRARRVAQEVRQWLLLRGTAGPVAATLTALLQQWPQAPSIHVEGDPRVVDDDGPAARAAAARLDQWIPRVRGGAVRITVSRTGGTASVLVHSDRPGACEDPDAWRDEDGWWLHLTWVPDAALAGA